MLNIDIYRCSACTACIHSCPTNAISQIKNENGFLLPFIDTDICIDCGACDKVCDFIKEKKTDSNIKQAYSLELLDRADLFNSTSGGAFTALSDIILERDGYIAGAIMDQNFDVRHIITQSREGRNSMRGSKYVQSNLDDIFVEIKKFLDEDKYLMFVGTPCQTAGLLSFLNKEYPKLYIVDFLCHGVPNNDLFKSHIAYIQQFQKEKIVGYTFRDKSYGWTSVSPQGIKINNKFRYPYKNQAYYLPFFASNFSLRDTCYNCKYRSLYRYSDITIADFWGIERFTKKKHRKGISLVLVNSVKGQELMKCAKKSAIIQEYSVKEILYRVSTTPAKGSNRDEFWKLYHQQGYDAVCDKYIDNSIYRKFRFAVKKIVTKALYIILCK